mmetsp:Transcript_27849/g.23036  ORF Transcript_27849/g.23036 Transcript_27849/m.23036 type:complete len:116 (-) Transcript_27849:191-538(-)
MLYFRTEHTAPHTASTPVPRLGKVPPISDNNIFNHDSSLHRLPEESGASISNNSEAAADDDAADFEACSSSSGTAPPPSNKPHPLEHTWSFWLMYQAQTKDKKDLILIGCPYPQR